MKVGVGKFYRKAQMLYVPKAVWTALDLQDGDSVGFYVEDQKITIKKVMCHES